MMSNKKHIVFILDFYYPEYSANGICAKKIIDSLKTKYKITIIAIKTTEGSLNKELYDNYQIRRIETKEHYYRNKYKTVAKRKKPVFSKLKYTTLFRFVQIKRYLNAIFSESNISRILVDRYIEELRHIEDKIDMVVPLCYPFEAVYSSLKYKEFFDPQVKVAPYLFDKFSLSEGLHRTKWNKTLKMKKHLQLEREMFVESEQILCSWDWESHIKDTFPEFLEKITFVDVPALSKIKNSIHLYYKSNQFHLVYTGSLNKTVRPPEYTLRVIQKFMDGNDNYLFHLYSGGNCEAIVKKYSALSGGGILNHGNVSIEEAHSAINQATILISIGNTDISQTPSKIYEYMASGGPIIHFYQNINDPVIKLLEKYPLSYCISQNEFEFDENLMKFSSFVNKNQNSTKVKFDVTRNLFPTATPEYSADILDNLIRK